MRTITRLGAAILGLAAGVSTWHLSLPEAEATPVQVRPEVRVYGAAAEQVDLNRWAVRRFEGAGLEAPAVEIPLPHRRRWVRRPSRLREERTGGRLHDPCQRDDAPEPPPRDGPHLARREHHPVPAGSVPEFRGLRSWNASSDPWELRGYEQGAEIMSWALGERILTAQIPNNDPKQLAPAVELLTGVELPEPTIGD